MRTKAAVSDLGDGFLESLVGARETTTGAAGAAPPEPSAVALSEAGFAELVEASLQGWAPGMDPADDVDSVEYADLLAEVDALLIEGPPGAVGQVRPGFVGAAESLQDGLQVAGRGIAQAAGVTSRPRPGEGASDGPGGGAGAGAFGAGSLTGTPVGSLVGVFDSGVVEALETAGALRSQVEGVAFALAREASSRGLPCTVGLVLSEWLRVRCPWLSRTEAKQIQDVVAAGEKHWGVQLAENVAAGLTPVRRAAKVARTMRQLSAVLDTDDQEAFARITTAAAADPELSDLDLEVVCKKLLVDLLDKKPREKAKATAQELRRVSRRPLASGLTRFTVDAPDGDSALLEGVLNGALAAPAPAEDGTPDPRSWGQRAYDALLMVVNRGLSNPGAPPSSARASVMITIPAHPETGQPVGAGVTALGQVLDPEQVGRFACLGDVTPIALGEHGEPLSLGRTVRLATSGQFKALMVRDGQCTYPGCSVPGTWCDAHHVIWWCRGGGTDIDSLALLCPRHHTLVHDKDLEASIVGSIVTWHV